MDSTLTYLSLAVFGLSLGSFAGASVWRLRTKQLLQEKKDGKNINSRELTQLEKLSNKTITEDRSRCLHCSAVLKWYDLIPLFSWVTLRGKCRYCHNKIGTMELLVEIGLAAYFISLYAFWPYSFVGVLDFIRFFLWLIAGVCLAVLVIYDQKWSILPDQFNYPLIAIGAINSVIILILAPDKASVIGSIAGAVFILSGIYWCIYKLSNGKWIGFGDIKLGLALALLLADWKLAFIALFSANLIGCLLVLPSLLLGKLKRNSRVPFGPLLIAGFVAAALLGSYIINSYYYYLV